MSLNCFLCEFTSLFIYLLYVNCSRYSTKQIEVKFLPKKEVKLKKCQISMVINKF